MLARKILCSRGEYSLSRKIIFVQTNRHITTSSNHVRRTWTVTSLPCSLLTQLLHKDVCDYDVIDDVFSERKDFKSGARLLVICLVETSHRPTCFVVCFELVELGVC